MDRDKDSFRTVSRLEIVGTGRRRRFTDEAKLRVVEEGFSGDGRQVSATALKHDVSRSQLYRWRQLLREGRLGGVRIEGFVPAVITPEAPRVENSEASRGRMEVVSTNGRRVIVDRDVDVDVLLRLMRGLETLR
ncbi:transposase [Labrys miyagiensis]|uniref:Transposase n=1 Tax=Labrys miyagiensis TaxID=346912 RepID=A0ABQ6CRX8_9HYPH|nr:transposase [Labrys miyagiensis]GLS21027.1 transposase [Labrys miyagiensis]